MDSLLQLQVKQSENITSTVKRFVLGSGLSKLPAFGAGAHIRVHLPMGPRHYSLVNNPLVASDEYEIAVKRIDGQTSGSSFLHDDVRVGNTIHVSPPDNYFPLHLKGKYYLFYAAGIGITPILSMISFLKTIGRSFELHYVARSKAECAFYDQIANEFRDETTFYYMGRAERMKRLKQTLSGRKIGTQVYMCGPQTFMDELVTHAKLLGYPPHSIHFERFTSPKKSKAAQPFTVSVESKNRTIQVEAGRSLLETLEAEGFNVPYACRMGICGTCEVAVKNGQVEHFDTFLTEDERQEKLLSCVSRGVDHICIDL